MVKNKASLFCCVIILVRSKKLYLVIGHNKCRPGTPNKAHESVLLSVPIINGLVDKN